MYSIRLDICAALNLLCTGGMKGGMFVCSILQQISQPQHGSVCKHFCNKKFVSKYTSAVSNNSLISWCVVFILSRCLTLYGTTQIKFVAGRSRTLQSHTVKPPILGKSLRGHRGLVCRKSSLFIRGFVLICI